MGSCFYVLNCTLHMYMYLLDVESLVMCKHPFVDLKYLTSPSFVHCICLV